MFMEKLGFSAIVMVLGLLIVFVGLIILIFAVKALSAILRSGGKKKEAAPAPVKETPAAQAAIAPVQEAEETQAETDAQLIAVITAAILACEGANKRLVVRSVRRVGNAWNAAAREETLNF